MPPSPSRTDRLNAHWRRLGLLPGAPECVLKAAHRAQIERHHPDRGGDPEAAKQINIAYDELKGSGAAANEYVAANYHGEPWAVLGVSSAAEQEFVRRAAKHLSAELKEHRRLAERVLWAANHFGKVQPQPARARPVAPPPPPPRPRPQYRKRTVDAKPGLPEGLEPSVDFGSVAWRADVSRTIQLTWKRPTPTSLSVEAEPPIRAEVTASKVVQGRYSVRLSIDWDKLERSRNGNARGHTLDADIRIRWTPDGFAMTKAKGVLHYPAHVSASPGSLDLGTVAMNQRARASIALVATAATQATIEPPPWLRRADGAGRTLRSPLALKPNVPVRVEFAVEWPPIAERAKPSFAAGRSVRPTGRIVVRWNDQEFEIPVQMTVLAPR